MMDSKAELLGFIIIMIFSGCHSRSLEGSECRSKEWDYLTFRQQWPATFCMEEHQSCQQAEAATWTVHGLWPTNADETHCPSFCNSSDPFNPDSIKSIEAELNKYWPNLRTHQQHDEFWRHEWNRHGTCATSLPALDTELCYFSKSLELNRKYDVFQKLEQHGIVPSSKPYEVKDIINALQIFGSPKMECYYLEGKKYLYNVEMCFDKTFQLRACDTSMNSNQTSLYRQEPCGYGAVYYPQLMHGKN